MTQTRTPTWNPQPGIPALALPPLACDAHVHVFGPLARFPFDADSAIRSRRSGTYGWRATPADRDAAMSRGRVCGDTDAASVRRRLSARARR